jgi:acyl-CoA thioester hydrolase
LAELGVTIPRLVIDGRRVPRTIEHACKKGVAASCGCDIDGYDAGRRRRQEAAMKDEIRAPALFFAPFVSSMMRVEPQWIDYNGHLNMAYYHVMFDRAVDEVFSLVGLNQSYVDTRHASFFAAECHILYKRELTESDQIRVTAQLIAFDDKRLHYYLEMRHAHEGWLAATSENLSLHVDTTTRKVTPFPPDILANLALMKAAHSMMPLPATIGRIIGMPRKTAITVEAMTGECETETRH